MKNEQTDRLGTESTLKLLRDLSLPSILGMAVSATYNVVDGIFIGRGVGRDALAGITVAFPIQMLGFAIVLMMSVGAAALFSILLGQGDEKEARRCVGTAYTGMLLLTAGLVAGVLGFRAPLLQALGGHGDVYAYASDYVTVVVPFVGFLGFQILWENLTRAEGSARAAMVSVLISSLLNIGLDYLFIFGLQAGVRGAALATGLSQIAGAAYLGHYVWRRRARLVVPPRDLVPDPVLLRRMMAIGLPSFARHATFSIQGLILNNMVLLYGGELALASLGILGRVLSFLVLPVMGVIQGMRPIISYNYGARLYARVREVTRYSILGATGFLLAGFLLAQLFSRQVLGVFTTDPDLIREGARALRMTTMVFPIISVQIVGSAVFQSLDRPLLALVFSVVRQVLLFIPLLFLLPPRLGLDGVWFAYPLSDVMALVATGLALRWQYRRIGEDAPGS